MHPAIEDLNWLEPVAPAVALHQLRRTSEERVAEERRRETRLAAVFEPLMRIDGRAHGSHGTPRRSGSSAARSGSTGPSPRPWPLRPAKILCIQPHNGLAGHRGVVAEGLALDRDQALLDRGALEFLPLDQQQRLDSPMRLARYEQLNGDVEARSLDQITDRLIAVDRTVAFIPADKDGFLALEVRHPALVSYLVTTFDRLLRLATPMYPKPSSARPTTASPPANAP